MKNQPLAIQIWTAFAAFMLGIAVLVVLLVPWMLRPFFVDDMYARISDAQNILWEHRVVNGENPEKRPPPPDREKRDVKHLIFMDNELVMLTPHHLPPEVLAKIVDEVAKQKTGTKKYEQNVQDQQLYYMIRSEKVGGQSVSLVSYITGAYETEMNRSLLRQLVSIMGLVLLVGIPFALWLARYLSRPLRMMEQHVKQIADRKWHEPLDVNRKDELGRLGQSIERMRRRLIKQDEAQQSFLQHISHELKTPVMVIRSYAQAIRDGIFPKGNLDGSIGVIEEESERLEKRIRSLLYLTKLDYLASREHEMATVDLSLLVEDVIARLRVRRLDIEWEIDIVAACVRGDDEQLSIAIENLLDNQIRHAAQKASVTLKMVQEEDQSRVLLRFWNDGGSIESDVKDTLFMPFYKGKKGQFGLGLTIVRQIAELHGTDVWVENEDGGVAFYLRMTVE
ncbi:two-component system sensor histidine kinase CssS [Aneurinibacillus soli]|uniref:histidine kinase n=1 Tax=Aneurinibacillus soli TaxID=1500254 RepID=A0A0U4WGP3_9BACL|nr:HAMP domain-containing sensor histidine kinase [Aneurinibacillus soli]PYE61322.1 two-component system sensor histidine kinase CssS [Aneurinibacillus soli]BAU27849.1 Sensor histidine kinase CssS [Aneurinibacillus soli]